MKQKVLNKRAALLLSIMLIILIVAILYFVILGNKRESYSIEKEGIIFIIHDSQPVEIISQMKQADKVVVSPAIVKNNPANQNMSSALASLVAVLSVKQKIVISMARNYDSNGELINCQTNDGNKYANRSISKEECLSYLSAKNPVQLNILIEAPDNRLDKSKVELTNYEIVIRPRTKEEINRVSLVVIKTLYSDSEEIIAAVNAALKKLNR